MLLRKTFEREENCFFYYLHTQHNDIGANRRFVFSCFHNQQSTQSALTREGVNLIPWCFIFDFLPSFYVMLIGIFLSAAPSKVSITSLHFGPFLLSVRTPCPIYHMQRSTNEKLSMPYDMRATSGLTIDIGISSHGQAPLSPGVPGAR